MLLVLRFFTMGKKLPQLSIKVHLGGFWGGDVTVDLGKPNRRKPSTHTATFNSNGGTEIAQKRLSGLKIKEPSRPTKDKYVFRGWYEDSTFSKKFDFNNTPITSNRLFMQNGKQQILSKQIRLAGDIQYGTVPVGNTTII